MESAGIRSFKRLFRDLHNLQFWEFTALARPDVIYKNIYRTIFYGRMISVCDTVNSSFVISKYLPGFMNKGAKTKVSRGAKYRNFRDSAGSR